MAEHTGRKRLEGKVAIVTGAGAGIGRADAMLFADQGAKVYVNYIDVKNGESIAKIVVDEIRMRGGDAVANTDSVAELDGAQRLVKTAIDAFSRLDILVNNAGITNFIPVYDLTESDWDRIMAVHLKGSFGMIKFASPIMCKQRSGVIINTGSESGLGRAFGANYCAAKEGIIGLTRAVAREIGRFNVRCNAIRPRAAGTTITGSIQRRWTSSFPSSRRWEGTGPAIAPISRCRWKYSGPKESLRSRSGCALMPRSTSTARTFMSEVTRSDSIRNWNWSELALSRGRMGSRRARQLRARRTDRGPDQQISARRPSGVAES